MTNIIAPTIATAFVVSVLAAHADAGLIGINYTNGRVFSISTADASATAIGQSRQGIMGLDRSPEGTLYAITDGITGGLGVLDTSSWQLGIVGPMNAGFTSEGGIAFDAEGHAIGGMTIAGGGRAIFEIDTATGRSGERTVLSRPSIDLNGLAFRPDGVLVAIDRVSNEFVSIDRVTGQVSRIADLISPGIGAVGGLAIDHGVGYYATAGSVSGSDGDNHLYGIDLYTGDQWLVGELGVEAGSGFGIGALASDVVPAPAPTGALTMCGFARLCRRRRSSRP